MDRKENRYDLYIVGFGVFLLSMSLLMLEIIYTRVAKVSFGNDFQFIIISLAILGIGLGGMLVYFFINTSFFKNNYDKIMYILIILYSTLLLVPFFILHYLNNYQFLAQLLFFISTLFVYSVFGVYISAIFAMYIKKIALVYFFSLVGSAFGAFIAIKLLDIFGVGSTVIAIFFISFLPIFLFNFNKKNNNKYLFLLFVLFILFILVLFRYLPSYLNIVCPYLEKPKFSETNSFSQIDTYEVEKIDNYPPLGIKLPNDVEIYDIKIDCIGTTTFVEFKPKKIKFLEKTIKYLPYTLKNYSNSLIFGSGAGVEVVMAVLAGNKKVTAVEINPLIISRVKELTQAEPQANIYNHNSVELVLDEARNFVSKSSDKYDLIYIPNTKRWGGTGVSSYALLENYLYTEEAIKLYFKHLKNDGIIAMEDRTWFILRYIETVILVMKNYGIDLKNNIALIEGDPHSVVIFKKKPFTSEELNNLKIASSKLGLSVSFLEERDILFFEKDVIPIKDNHPFYWDKYSLYNLLSSNKIKYESFLTFKNEQFISLKYLFVLFLLTLIVSIISFALLPLLYKSGHYVNLFKFSFYFFFIGAGFIILELVLIHKFTIFVVKPVHSLSVVLATILFFSGIGSYFVPILSKKFKFFISYIGAILIFITLIYSFKLTSILNQFSHFDLPLKIILSIVLISIPSFFMGMFFPFGLGIVNNFSNRLVPWMWGINGIASTLGGVLSMIISLLFGFNTALLVGIVCYFMAVVIIRNYNYA